MFLIQYQYGSNRQKSFKATSGICSIGCARGNDLVLKSRKLSKRHIIIRLVSDELYLEDLGSLSGTWVNQQRVRQFGPLSELDEIVAGDINLRVSLCALNTVLASVQAPLYTVQNETTDSTESENQVAGRQVEVDEANLIYWGSVVHEQLLAQMDLRRKDVSRMSDAQLREESSQLLEEIIDRLATQFPPTLAIDLLKRNVLNEAIGLGPLEKYLQDDSISEIMVNCHNEIFIEKAGIIEKSAHTFSSELAVYAVIDRIITPLGRRVDESSPIIDARLKDGSRVNAVIPPLALKGPALTIRKFPKKRLLFSDLLAAESVSRRIVDFMRVCVEQHKNVIVSGGTGSGKTTLLNVLSNFIPDTERIVTIEDAAELRLAQSNLVSLESRPASIEGRGCVSIRELVRNALRMRPDRIVIGECRGGEALDMLQAMNTGHDGSLTTIHANNPRDVISRLEVLVLMAGMELPVQAIREQIASAVDIIVQQTRFPCGTRKVTRVTEIVGIESGTLQLQDIFMFQQNGFAVDGKIRGRFVATGAVPVFYDALREIGLNLDLSLFSQEERD